MRGRTILLTRMAMLIAVGFALSYILVIPLFGARVYPAQHMVDVVAAVTVGPWYGMLVGLIIALMRIGAGTATILAVPGSIFGAVVAGLLYRATRSRIVTIIGEVFGVGVVGGLAAYPVAVFLLGNDAAAAGGITFFILPWSTSALVGALMGGAILAVLEPMLSPGRKKAGVLRDGKLERTEDVARGKSNML